MPEPLSDYVATLGSSLRIADIVDIAVVSVIVYGGISWFRRSQSRLVMSGLVTLALLYFVARLLDMHLTLALFQPGITVAVLALVVIFQEELRRAFERIALASRFESTGAKDALQTDVDTLVAAATNLASSRTGALIVLRGREPLERHLTGGVFLKGQLSEALLYSIFDSSSPGHDGALVVEGGLAARFGAQLPLTLGASKAEAYGTRHAAALGLSERCDALVLVVSEERGEISIAKDGQLTKTGSRGDLKRRIVSFKAGVSPPRRRGRARYLFTKNLGAKLLSVLLALAAWLVAFGYRTDTAIATITAPVVFKNVPEGWVIEDAEPFEVLVSLSGPAGQLEGLQSNDVNVTVDVSEPEPGRQRTNISSHDVRAPSGFAVRGLDPNSIRFTAQRTVTTEVPVQPQSTGTLPPGYRLNELSVQPSQVAVVVTKSQAPGLERIATEPVPLRGLTRSATFKRALVLPNGATLAPDAPTSVNVRVEVVAPSP